MHDSSSVRSSPGVVRAYDGGSAAWSFVDRDLMQVQRAELPLHVGRFIDLEWRA